MRTGALLFVTAVVLHGCDSKRKPIETTESSDGSSNARVVTLKKRMPAVGDTETRKDRREERTRLGFRGAKGGVDVDTTKVEQVVRTEKCLEVAGGICTKLKVTYATDTVEEEETSQKVDLDGRPIAEDKPRTEKTRKTRPNEGKSYIVTRGTVPTILLEDGSQPTQAEIDSVKTSYLDDGSTARDMLAALPSSLRVGDSLDSVAQVLVAEQAKHARGAKAVATVTVRDIRDIDGRTVITLAIEIDIAGPARGAEGLKMGLAGTIDLLADGTPIRRENVASAEGVIEEGTKLKGTMKDSSEITPGP